MGWEWRVLRRNKAEAPLSTCGQSAASIPLLHLKKLLCKAAICTEFAPSSSGYDLFARPGVEGSGELKYRNFQGSLIPPADELVGFAF